MTSLGPRRAGIPARIRKLLHSLAAALLLALLLSRPECGLTAQTQADPSPPQTLAQLLRSLGYGSIPLERGSNNRLLLEATVTGHKRVLLLDTGSTATLLDRRVAARLKTVGELGIDLVDPVLRAHMPTNAVLITELKLGDCRFENQPALSMPLGASGVGVEGMIGCDFLIRQHAIVDCAGKKLFVRAGPLESDKRRMLKQVLERSGYTEVLVEREDSLVSICTSRINRLDLRLVLDTGSVYTTIDDDAANRCHIVWSGTRRRAVGIGERGSVPLSVGTPESFALAGKSILYPGTSIGACEMRSWGIGQDKQGQVHGVLGAELLARTQALIDFDQPSLWFVPAPERPGEKH